MKVSWYYDVHVWIKKKKGKALYCEIDKLHKYKYYHWANISKKYKYKLNDWIMLCPKCHRLFDLKKLTVNKLKEINELKKVIGDNIDINQKDTRTLLEKKITGTVRETKREKILKTRRIYAEFLREK